ncbi:methyltransferase [Nocardiopsis alba]|uniref:Methyltransferase n=1 Tax=Nocardiopsis alba TaxID=53437 RepID=A0A7K2IP56_9ACTN|nr:MULTISPECIES: methyltransferase [Nocardiopsis]MEC3894041.1 methyltransferase [Nocardiopsis sp. LDBS1602]MYR31656.1 methyltransferase [Nocardiopsis alba]
MSNDTASGERPPMPAGPPPADRMRIRELSTAPWLSQALYAVTKLGVPDALIEGALPVEEIADRVGADPAALHRFLRALTSAGVFAEVGSRVYELNAPARHLCSDTPASMRHIVIMHGEETFRAFADVLHTVRTGLPSFDAVYGKGFYEYLPEHPEAEATFHAAMGISGAPPVVADEIDFRDPATVIDLGGGSGALLTRVLERYPDAKGVLVDVADAVAEAERVYGGTEVGARMTFVPGDFFGPAPRGDVYLLSRVLHNWDDERAGRILDRIREVIPEEGRLCVLDRVVPDVSGPHPSKIADLVMLVVLGGGDRTRKEYGSLLERHGFSVESLIPPSAGADPRAESAIVARPV